MDMTVFWGFQIRACLCAFSFSVVRLYMFIVQKGTWFVFEEPKLCSEDDCVQKNDEICIGDYNKDLMDSGLFIRRIILVSILITTFLLSILSYKWRSLSNAFLYLECMLIIIASLIPNGFNYSQDRVAYFWTHTVILMCFYTGDVR